MIRRALISAVLPLVAVASLVSPTAHAQNSPAECGVDHTVNGSLIIDADETETWYVGGREFKTAPGEPTRIFREFTEWFDKNIEPIGYGDIDDWSWNLPESIDTRPEACSNHGSGTAVDLNAYRHPLNERGGFTERQTLLIRQKVKSYGGHLVWGGNWTDPVDEMHFEYTKNPTCDDITSTYLPYTITRAVGESVC